FSKALARTIHELRLAGVGASELAGGDAASADIGRLLARVEAQFGQAAVADRAALFAAATVAVARGDVRWTRVPIVLLAVPLDAAIDREFIGELARHAPSLLAVVPDGDDVPARALSEGGARVERVDDAAAASSDLAHLRRHVFTIERPPQRKRAGDVVLFSAPGEGRESIEIVRRMLDEAERGVRFDQMAVFLRTPGHYLGLLEHACHRGGVPAYFERGSRRPDPSA